MMEPSSPLPQRPTEGGVEQSMLRWLRDTLGLPDGLQWAVYGLQDDSGDRTEGAKVLDDQYDRESGHVVYWQLLREQLIAINDAVTEQNVDRLLASVRRAMDQDELMAGNRAVHQLLRDGIRFDTQHGNGTTKVVYAKLIDVAHPERNRFDAVNQMRVTRRHSVRPDVTLLVNGLPLVQIELKSLAQDNDFTTAIRDLRGYEEKVPRLFLPTLFNVAADTQQLRYGAIQAPQKFYFPWSDAPDRFAVPGAESDAGRAMKQAVQALLNPETLLDILRNFVFYEKAEGGDVKIVPRHMQYYAVERILDRIRKGDPGKKRGLIWHWQDGQIADPEAVDALEEIERAVIALENERDERGVSEAEYAVFSLLTDDYGVPEDEAQSFAEDLCARFQEEIDTNFPGWETNTNALRNIKVLIYKALPALNVDADKKELADALRSYLVANAE